MKANTIRVSAVVAGAYDMVIGKAKTEKGLQRHLNAAQSLRTDTVIVDGNLHGCPFIRTMTIPAARNLFATA